MRFSATVALLGLLAPACVVAIGDSDNPSMLREDGPAKAMAHASMGGTRMAVLTVMDRTTRGYPCVVVCSEINEQDLLDQGVRHFWVHPEDRDPITIMKAGFRLVASPGSVSWGRSIERDDIELEFRPR